MQMKNNTHTASPAGLSMQRVRKNLIALRQVLPDDDQPMARLRICSDGESVVAVEDDVIYEPASGQVVMAFAVATLSSQVAEILALPRPIMLKRVLAQAAALGVGRIFLINANRVEKSFFSATMVKQSDFKEHLIHGLEQGMDTRLPEISIHERFRPFSEDLLPVIINDYPVRLIAHPEGNRYLFDAAPRPADQRALLAIGPEGGWVDFEVEKFKAQGLILFSMGPRILRVDSAVPALLSQIDLLRRMTAKQPCV